MIKRILIYLAGVLCLGLGLVLNTKTGLGTSAIMSVPYTLSLLTTLSLGTWTTIFYIAFMVVEIILQRKLNVKVLLQLPFSWLFGRLLDLYNAIIPIDSPVLPLAVLLAFAAIFFTALGVVMMVAMDLIVNPADGFVGAWSDYLHQPFGKIKTIVDGSMLAVTLLICLLFVHRLVGVGIGTVLAVVCTGNTMNFLTARISAPLKKAAFPEQK